MSNIAYVRTFFPRRVNMYVPKMEYSASVNQNGMSRVSFGAVPVPAVNYLLNAVSIATTVTYTSANFANNSMFPHPYGANIALVCSAANVSTVVCEGWDYLGQPMSENIVLAGATQVNGVKAFKWLRQATFTGLAAATISMGFDSKLGLPYKAVRVGAETNDGQLAAAGTLQAPSLVEPQTATTLDPRGMYTLTTVPNGAAIMTATFDFQNDLSRTTGNGGLHGLPHFSN
jgi:hypothetical protein